MNKQNIAEKQALQPLTWMGKGSHASGGQQSNKAVAIFYNSAFSSLVKEMLLATNCYSKGAVALCKASVNKQ